MKSITQSHFDHTLTDQERASLKSICEILEFWIDSECSRRIRNQTIKRFRHLHQNMLAAFGADCRASDQAFNNGAGHNGC